MRAAISQRHTPVPRLHKTLSSLARTFGALAHMLGSTDSNAIEKPCVHCIPPITYKSIWAKIIPRLILRYAESFIVTVVGMRQKAAQTITQCGFAHHEASYLTRPVSCRRGHALHLQYMSSDWLNKTSRAKPGFAPAIGPAIECLDAVSLAWYTVGVVQSLVIKSSVQSSHFLLHRRDDGRNGHAETHPDVKLNVHVDCTECPRATIMKPFLGSVIFTTSFARKKAA